MFSWRNKKKYNADTPSYLELHNRQDEFPDFFSKKKDDNELITFQSHSSHKALFSSNKKTTPNCNMDWFFKKRLTKR